MGDPNIKYPDSIAVTGRMIKNGISPLGRKFAGEAIEYTRGRLFGKIYVDGNKAKEIYERDQDEISRLRKCLEDTRNEICEGPVDDTLWHQEIPACTTVENICMALDDDWDYDAWLAAQKEAD